MRHIPFFALTLAALAVGPGNHASADDTQYWNELILKPALAPRTEVEIASEQKMVDDMKDFGLINLTVEPAFTLAQGLIIGPGYRYEREREEGEWLVENRYWCHASIKRAWGDWKGRFKATLEYRDLEEGDGWRLRTKFKLQHPLNIAGRKAALFLSDEPFYDFQAERWNQNRAAAGWSSDLAENLELTVYYMNVAKDGGDDWGETHVAGTEWVWSF